MTLSEEFMVLKSRFEGYKQHQDASPTDPAFALVRATNEQTLAIYLIGALIAEFIADHKNDVETAQKLTTQFATIAKELA